MTFTYRFSSSNYVIIHMSAILNLSQSEIYGGASGDYGGQRGFMGEYGGQAHSFYFWGGNHR